MAGLLFFVLLIGGAIFITYVQLLGAKLASTNDENEKLLNGMHEGLLII